MATSILVFIAGLVVGGGLTHSIVRKKCGGDCKCESSEPTPAEDKADNKEKALELFDSMEKVTNNDVENILKVSDATAERYLNELEKEGKISQVGETGQSVYYVKK